MKTIGIKNNTDYSKLSVNPNDNYDKISEVIETALHNAGFGGYSVYFTHGKHLGKGRVNTMEVLISTDCID